MAGRLSKEKVDQIGIILGGIIAYLSRLKQGSVLIQDTEFTDQTLKTEFDIDYRIVVLNKQQRLY